MTQPDVKYPTPLNYDQQKIEALHQIRNAIVELTEVLKPKLTPPEQNHIGDLPVIDHTLFDKGRIP